MCLRGAEVYDDTEKYIYIYICLNMFATSRVTLEDLGLRARTLGSGAASLRENVRFYVGRGMGGQPSHAIDDSIRPSRIHPRGIGARDSRVRRGAHDRRLVPTSWDRSDGFLVTGSTPFERTVSNYVSTQSRLQTDKVLTMAAPL